MRKLLSLVLAFAMILGLFTFPVSADATTYQTVGQELAGLGVLKGVDAKGTLAEMQKLTREQALVVLTRLMGQEDKALATDAQPGFTDVPATHWSAKYVAYAKLQGWTNGTSETQFGLGSDVTTKQVVTLMMRALGYTADWSKEDVVKKAQELGLLEGVSATPDDAIIRGELFIVMKNTLYTKPMGEKIELIYKLGLAENPIPSTLEVVDVKATNLKEVVVEFNQEVDKTTLEDAFSSVGLSLGKITPDLQEDGKTVVLSVTTTMKNKQVYKITISKVKSLSGLTVEKVTKEFKTEDNETPKVEKIEVTGPKSFKVMFSEPIKTPGTIKLKLDGKVGPGVNVKRVQGSEKAFEATTGTALKDGSTYTALVQNFVDYAGYKNIDSEVEFEYAKVTDAPVAEVVKAEQEYVVVKFNRPVKGLKLENFYHTYRAWKPVSFYSSVKEMDDDTNKGRHEIDSSKAIDMVVVRFIQKPEDFVKKSTNNDWHPLQVGDVEFTVLGQVGSRKVVDNWGNQLQDTDIKVTIAADKEAPVVESVEVESENEIAVNFSKKVVAERNDYELLNADGSKISGLAFTVAADGTKVKIKVTNPKLVGKSVILNVKNVRDNTINMNKMVGTESFNVTFGDKTFDGVKEAILKKKGNYAENPTIFVVFKEAVDSTNATNIKNYKFTNSAAAVPAEKDYFTIEADTAMFSDSVVQLTMSKETLKKFGANPRLVISNAVTDLNGNTFASFTSGLVAIQMETGSKPQLVAKNPVVATDKFHVTMKFDQPLMVGSSDIDTKLFKVTVDGKTRTVDSVEFKDTMNKTLELTLREDRNLMEGATVLETGYGLTSDLHKVKIEYVKPADVNGQPASNALVNELNTALDSFTRDGKAQIKDEIKPFFAKEVIKKGSSKGDDINDIKYEFTLPETHKIIITYDEKVDPRTLSNTTYKIIADSEYGTETVSPTGTDAANKVVTLTFRVPSGKRPSFYQGLRDSVKNPTTKIETDGKTYYSFLKLAVNSNNAVQDEEGNAFGNTDLFDVYHENKGGIATVAGSDDDSFTDVTEPVMSTQAGDVVMNDQIQPDANPTQLKFTIINNLKTGETAKIEWFKADGTSVQAAVVGLTSTYTPPKTLGTTEYYALATITNASGFSKTLKSRVVSITVNGAKAFTVTPKDGGLVENLTNDGTVGGSLELKLTSAKYADQASVSAGIQVINVPAGTAAIITRVDDTTAKLTLTGKAAAHAEANNVNNLTITLTNAALADGEQASNLAGHNTFNNGTVTFLNPASLVWSGAMKELAAQPQVIISDYKVVLTNGAFKLADNTVLTEGTHFEVSNVKGGLATLKAKVQGTVVNNKEIKFTLIPNPTFEEFNNAAEANVDDVKITLKAELFIDGSIVPADLQSPVVSIKFDE